MLSLRASAFSASSAFDVDSGTTNRRGVFRRCLRTNRLNEVRSARILIAGGRHCQKGDLAGGNARAVNGGHRCRDRDRQRSQIHAVKLRKKVDGLRDFVAARGRFIAGDGRELAKDRERRNPDDDPVVTE